MNAKDFITFAEMLTHHLPGSEAGYRSAVSRAYYGALHATGELLQQLGVPTSRNHGEFQHNLANSGNPDAIIAANLLADLQSIRIKADYRLNDATIGTKERAISAVLTANKVTARLERCRESNSLKKMRQAIQVYRQRRGGV